MAWKKNATILVGALSLGMAGMSILAPSNPNTDDSTTQKQVQDLSDAHDKANDDLQNKADADELAHQQGKIVPGEHRPPVDPHGPHLRIRVP